MLHFFYRLKNIDSLNKLILKLEVGGQHVLKLILVEEEHNKVLNKN